MIKKEATIDYAANTADLRNFVQKFNLADPLVAKVLLKNISPDQHVIFINKGERDGICKDMVAVYKFQIVGRVSEVFRNYSKVVLITDQTCKIAAYTTKHHAYGILCGQNNPKRCSLSYVSHLCSVKEGEYVLSSGKGLVFPQGYCLGKVVKQEVQGLNYAIDVSPLVDLRGLKFCLILTDSAANPL